MLRAFVRVKLYLPNVPCESIEDWTDKASKRTLLKTLKTSQLKRRAWLSEILNVLLRFISPPKKPSPRRLFLWPASPGRAKRQVESTNVLFPRRLVPPAQLPG